MVMKSFTRGTAAIMMALPKRNVSFLNAAEPEALELAEIDGKPMLAVANEVSGTTTLWAIK